ncbi:hypothetical protein QYM36_015135 [Artemia franciscana]|uniref:ENTH domain-containing protein n=1 Tax=Artemia franciscana TaxID=6661 RepID=A0AA88HH37_ARTSF|nr:hypothetical protein QYM36_015135 [Artemia franciscana]
MKLKEKIRLYKSCEIQEIVRKVAHEEADDPDPRLMSKIAKCTSEPLPRTHAMTYIWNKLTRSKKWSHIEKLLLLLEYLVKEGNKDILEDCTNHLDVIDIVGKQWSTKRHGKRISDLVAELMCCITNVTVEENNARKMCEKKGTIKKDENGGDMKSRNSFLSSDESDTESSPKLGRLSIGTSSPKLDSLNSLKNPFEDEETPLQNVISSDNRNSLLTSDGYYTESASNTLSSSTVKNPFED